MKALIKKVAYKAGYRILKSENVIDKKGLLRRFYATIKKQGFKPGLIVDIGAHIGMWTREALKFFPDASYLLIEPQEALSRHFQDLLQSPKIKYLPVGAGNKNDVLKFTMHDRPDSRSFIYSEKEALEKGYKQIEVPIKTLNTIIREQQLPYPDMVKIDAEGFDLEVLEGASELFGKTEVFLVEAGIQNKMYKNSLLRIVNKMDEAGYELYDITDLIRPFPDMPVLCLAELAFVKKGGLLTQFSSNLYH